MDTDVDAYFAQHDIPSVVSDMLFELGFHRPKDVGNFIASYVGRRFHLDGPGGGGLATRGNDVDGKPMDTDFSTIEVHLAPATTGSDEALACALLEEVRALRKKYKDFQAQALGENAATAEDATSFAMIPWTEFKADYERLLLIFTSPQLWSWCERRLALLRGLFDAHRALNASAEELLRRSAGGEARAGAEVVPGLALGDLLGKLGRTPGPLDITADADAPVPSADGLCGVFSRTSNHVRGQFLAEAALSSFRLLEKTAEPGRVETYAEYRLPLHPANGAWTDLARWVAEFGVRSSRVSWVVQIKQSAYGELQECRSVASFEELLENAFGPPTAAALAAAGMAEAPHSAAATQMSHLLEDVGAFELAAANGGAEGLTAEADREPRDWAAAASPPYPYQLYHAWARLKALNACRAEAELEPLGLRSAASTAEPLACAYLLGVSGASRCGALSAHTVLQYLFLVDGVTAMVSLASRRSLGGAGELGARALSRLQRAGVSLALCTEDPTVSQQSDDALEAEYCLARTMGGLSEADLAELARNSIAASRFEKTISLGRQQAGSGEGVEEAREEQQEGHRRGVRERYRGGRRCAELELLARLAPRADAAKRTISYASEGL